MTNKHNPHFSGYMVLQMYVFTHAISLPSTNIDRQPITCQMLCWGARMSQSLSLWSLQTTRTGARPNKKALSDAKPTALTQKREISMRLINGIYHKTFTSYSLSLKMIDCIGIQANGYHQLPFKLCPLSIGSTLLLPPHTPHIYWSRIKTDMIYNKLF